ncbi:MULTISPECIES: hypothetical protein [Mammaliicoccus]|jgi:hypothetical protein|uniref:Uncharacterized protein n=1 Tax=Mammaliicoccus sciuri TaxID=1296 RepID=A0AAW5LJX8_MAMSC|nr:MULTISPECIES: hypothetical protein [Mammaliicoccus]MBA1395582.1 hypothetical protein [Mammaliicoccus sciuri]MBG9205887.1 hypothetical protein [Mammaliicoccus sciuri]MBG9209493.1 hypothetical protein [Mammaliicoccus sciuri]MBO1209249.1 hypothetical protein [Mammaliicoccus sciuri]MBU6087494.1 hypothetical protein [Mammaliicoccus sciuri]
MNNNIIFFILRLLIYFLAIWGCTTLTNYLELGYVWSLVVLLIVMILISIVVETVSIRIRNNR